MIFMKLFLLLDRFFEICTRDVKFRNKYFLLVRIFIQLGLNFPIKRNFHLNTIALVILVILQQKKKKKKIGLPPNTLLPHCREVLVPLTPKNLRRNSTSYADHIAAKNG